MGRFIGIELPLYLQNSINKFRSERGYPATTPNVGLITAPLLVGTKLVQQKLESFCLDQVDFHLVVAGAQLHADRLLYLRVMPGAVNMIRSELAAHLGVQEDRGIYRPHITLLRKREGFVWNPQEDLERAAKVFSQTVDIDVEHLTLFDQEELFGPCKTQYAVPLTGRP